MTATIRRFHPPHQDQAKGLMVVLLLCVGVCLEGCARAAEPAPATVAQARTQTSASCRECHLEIHAAWSSTDHALANRPVVAPTDTPTLASFPAAARDGRDAVPEMILGHKPLWQPLLPAEGGRWQPHETAYDPAREEWFNVFGTENRQVGEWGHWTGRGMNWNSMCAQCHMTGYQKNYSPESDTYRSTWVEHGVGCIQCHGPTKPGHGAKGAVKEKSPAPYHGDRQKMMQTCLTCHTRAEALTADFQPGDAFSDHFRVTLPVEAATFYPDGQQRDEDFDGTSILLSRMGHAGVTCMDCHDPHTTKLVLPTAQNQLCLQCHAAPGRVQPNGRQAVAIDPLTHSHHAEGSAGNTCVGCHMPTTTYMQRAPRHDHGWLKPDPLLTQELGIPNACGRCHADKPVAWMVARSDEWYGAKLESRQRARARAIAAAQAGKPGAEDTLLALLQSEDIPAWRATYLSLLASQAASQPVVQAGQSALSDGDPLVRAAAVRLLTGTAEATTILQPALHDASRLVRLDAAWALSGDLAPASPERRELDAYLDLALDQPSGRLRLGQDLANRGQLAAAEKQIGQAAAWDPYSPGILDTQATVLAAAGRPAEAANALVRAMELAPADATLAMRAGLALAEAGRLADAEKSFRLAVERDPRLDRAWYNLGLLLAQSERLGDAITTLQQAERLAPVVPEYSYALATVQLRAGDLAAARESARRTLRLDPGNRAAQQILNARR